MDEVDEVLGGGSDVKAELDVDAGAAGLIVDSWEDDAGDGGLVDEGRVVVAPDRDVAKGRDVEDADVGMRLDAGVDTTELVVKL